MIFLIFFAQTISGPSPYVPEYYVFPTEDKVLIEVQLWGHISKPGLYQVPLRTDLVKLISLAGGPLPSADLRNVVIIRDGENRSVNVEKILKTEKVYLEPGDVIIVPANTSTRFKDMINFLQNAVTFLTQVILIYTFFKAQK
ncbi:MAG: SLBB domain-containing protein [Candidatus Hydrothermales bacterium]